ncbi:sensor histidine kinase [Acetivibrio clariflavus]|uniref:sensor histidine kinase n=1 Tax=Acetivibrio clariflavus TaxID=288965 RepID=UPI0004ADDE55|nr:histidine kinase [Acetivibrio clariflavus]
MLSRLRHNSSTFLRKSIPFFIVFTEIVIVFIGFSLLTFLNKQSSHSSKLPQAINGVLDLSDWNFQTDGTVKLQGHWKFYWNKLLDPWQFTVYPPQKEQIAPVPAIWKNLKSGRHFLPDEGYATYRLLVKLNSLPQNLALNVKFFISSCKIWLDNEKIYESGIVSTDPEKAKGCFNPEIILIHPQENQFYITVQISNYRFANGGFITELELGDALTVINQKNSRSFKDLFLFGSIMIMGLYHLTLFVLRRKEYYTLYFSILCFLLSLRTLLMGEMLLYSFFPAIPLSVFLKLSQSTLSIGLTVFVMYVHSFFPEDTPIWFVRLSQASGILFTALIILTSDKVFSSFLLPFQISSMLIIVLLLIILAKSVYQKRDTSLVFFFATSLGAVIIINDTLNGYGLISTGFYIPVAQFLFIFVQSFILFRKLMKSEEQLLKSELRMLQAQIKPHFLFNALNTIISVCRVSSEKAIELLLYLSDYLRCGFSFKNDEEFVNFETEILHVKSYLALENARFSDKLKVVFDIDESIDCKVPPYIIQPLVENAVRHGILPLKNGGTVKLSAKQKNNQLSIVVEDDGVGMSEQKLAAILNGTEKKSGIGLTNVRNRIKRIYKREIEIKSEINKGTAISINIPLIKGAR